MVNIIKLPSYSNKCGKRPLKVEKCQKLSALDILPLNHILTNISMNIIYSFGGFWRILILADLAILANLTPPKNPPIS